MRYLSMWFTGGRSISSLPSSQIRPQRVVTELKDTTIVDLIVFERLLAGDKTRSSSLIDTFLAGRMPEPGLFCQRPLIFAGRERRTGQQAVIKIIHKATLPASTGGEQIWMQLCNRLLQLPYHPNVLTFYGVYEDAERYYIITEMLKGGELFNFLLHEVSVPEELCKHIIRQILLPLEFLHMRNFVHRDVKPENLMFRESTKGHAEFPYMKDDLGAQAEVMEVIRNYLEHFELVLIDFDTIRMTDVDDYNEWVMGRHKKRLVGTYNYMAPELLRGRDYTPASDLWSVGIILYILMTGVPPVPMHQMRCAATTLASLKSVEESGGINFDVYPLNIFPMARNLCQQLLAFNPACRLDSASTALRHPWLSHSAPLSAKYYIASSVPVREGNKKHFGKCPCKTLKTSPKALPSHSIFTLPPMPGLNAGSGSLSGVPSTHVSTPTRKVRGSYHDLSNTSTILNTNSDLDIGEEEDLE